MKLEKTMQAVINRKGRVTMFLRLAQSVTGAGILDPGEVKKLQAEEKALIENVDSIAVVQLAATKPDAITDKGLKAAVSNIKAIKFPVADDVKKEIDGL